MYSHSGGLANGFYFSRPHYGIAEIPKTDLMKFVYTQRSRRVHRPLAVYLFYRNRTCYPVSAFSGYGDDEACTFNLKCTRKLARPNTTTSRQHNCFDPTGRHRAHRSTPAVITCQFFVEGVLPFWIRVRISGAVRRGRGFRAVADRLFCERIRAKTPTIFRRSVRCPNVAYTWTDRCLEIRTGSNWNNTGISRYTPITIN